MKLIRPVLVRPSAVFLPASLFVFLLLAGGVSRGDIVLQGSVQQQGGAAELGAFRSIYLGRLFVGDSVAPGLTSFSGIYAGTVIRNASNVALYAGNGTSNFEANIANFSDTGLRFSTSTTTDDEAIFLPSLPPPFNAGTPASPLPGVVGSTLVNQFSANNYIDFWLVGSSGSSFAAPSSSNPGGGGLPTPNEFYVGFAAIPEPSSLLLLTAVGAGFSAYRFRRNRNI